MSSTRAIGDHLMTPHPSLAVPTTLKGAGADSEPPTARVVIFVHGLAETGWTARYARDNSGQHISDSGASLDRSCEALVAGWPVPVTEIALVGHSMGGLVAWAALQQAELRGPTWSRLARQLRVHRRKSVALTGLNHLDLLNHPTVDTVLRRWLG